MKPSYLVLENRMDRSPWLNLGEILSTYTNSPYIFQLFKFLYSYSMRVEDKENREGRVFVDYRPLAACLLLYPIAYRVLLAILLYRAEYKQYKTYMTYVHLKDRLSYVPWYPLSLIDMTCKIRGESLNQRFINLLSMEDEGPLDITFLIEAIRIKDDIRKYLIPENLDINTFSFHIKQLATVLPLFVAIEEDDFYKLLNRNDRSLATRILVDTLNLPPILSTKLITFNRKVLKRVYINNIY